MFERTAAVPGLHSVDLDFEHGIETLLAELKNRGATRFGLIESDAATDPNPYQPTQRRRAYEKLAGPGSLDAIVVAEESMRGGADGFQRLWNTSPGLDAVLVFNDLMAMGAVHGAHTLGVSIPADVRVVGIDGLSSAASRPLRCPPSPSTGSRWRGPRPTSWTRCSTPPTPESSTSRSSARSPHSRCGASPRDGTVGRAGRLRTGGSYRPTFGRPQSAGRPRLTSARTESTRPGPGHR